MRFPGTHSASAGGSTRCRGMSEIGINASAGPLGPPTIVGIMRLRRMVWSLLPAFVPICDTRARAAPQKQSTGHGAVDPVRR